MTLVLTEYASSVIRTLADTNAEVADEAGLRIAGTGDGDRTDLAIAVAAAPLEEDQVVEQDGARIYLDPAAADVLDDKVLDATVEPDGQVRFLLSVQ